MRGNRANRQALSALQSDLSNGDWGCCSVNTHHYPKRSSVIASRGASAVCHEGLDIPDCLLTLVQRKRVNVRRRRIEAEFGRYPAQRLGARLERIDAITAHLARNERFEHFMQAALRFTKGYIGKPPKRNVTRAARNHTDPCLTGRADPYRPMVFPVWVSLFACAGEHCRCSAVIAQRSGEGFNRTADAQVASS